MNKVLITVVLPIYNVKNYLDRSIESVTSQTYTELEIILVDDGSTDGCSEICDRWALQDSRIKVIHKENAGLGMARNTGLDNATGEYICFFDSDDYIEKTAIEKLYATIEATSAQTVIFGLSKVDNHGTIIKTVVPSNEKILFSADEVLDEFLPELIAPAIKTPTNTRYYMSACTFMYSAELLKKSGWRFASERTIVSEDVYYLLGLFAYVKSVAVCPEALYYYRENLSSLSQRYLPGRYAKIKHFYIEALELSRKLGYSKKITDRLMKPFLGFVLAALKQEVTSGRQSTEIKSTVKDIIDDQILQDVLSFQKKNDNGILKRILYFAMRHKMYNICLLLIKSKA